MEELLSFKMKVIIIGIAIFIIIITSIAQLLIFSKNDEDEETEIEINEELTYLGEFPLPIENFITVTAKFGLYDPWGTGTMQQHNGLDLVGKKNSKIMSVEDGEVVISKMAVDYGNYIKIKHVVNEEEYYTLYAHMKERYLEVGDNVVKGQVIGIQGTTGNSTGDHLHFEIIKDNQRIDPYPYIFNDEDGI